MVLMFESCAFWGSLVGVRLRLRRGFIAVVNFVFCESCAFVRSLPLGRLPAGPSFVSQQKKQKCGCAPQKWLKSGTTAERGKNSLTLRQFPAFAAF